MAEAKVGTSFKELLEKEATVNAKGLVTLAQGKVEQFMKSNGFTESMLDKLKELQKEMTTGTVLYNNSALVEKIEELKKKSGKDWTDEVSPQVNTHIATPMGQIRAITVGKRTAVSNGINAGKEPAAIYGRTRMVVRVNKYVDKATVQECEDAIRKLYED